MAWKIEILDADGKKESIVDYEVATFTRLLNGIGSFRITIGSASGNYDFKKFNEYQLSNDSGNEQGIVYFTKDDVLEFKGVITDISYDSFGNMVLSGYDTMVFTKWLSILSESRSSENNDVRLTAWLNTIDNTYKLSVGTINSYSSNPLEANVYKNVNYFKAITEVVVDTCNQDYFVKFNSSVGGYDTFEVRDHAGSSSSIGFFVEGVDIKNVRYYKDTSQIINKVRVVGAYVSGSQVYADAEDTNSQAKYGVREPSQPFYNKRIKDNAQAQKVANQIIANYKEPIKWIGFDVVDNSLSFEDPDTSPRSAGCFSLGDTIW